MRAHLVHLRGGAPFLSPADALCLVGMLDAGVSVPLILAALDRCVASRMKNRARRPLTLTAAKRHLGKPPLVDPGFARDPGEAPLEPVRAALSGVGDPEATALAAALEGLASDEPDALVTEAVALCRTHHERRWTALPDDERERRIAAAIVELGDIANVVDSDTLRQLAEEVARDAFRSAWPRLDTATFEALVQP
ncbi:MAG: hypothetical protein H6737_19820 [Alphaproteobacteria bacterium]|nr:hypothetical protein [Alphaproteobacteria bacterium]